MQGFVLRWAYFVLGGALFTPYALLAMLAIPLAEPTAWITHHRVANVVTLSVLVLVLIALTAYVPLVRTLEGTAVPAMLGGAAADLQLVPARTRAARVRNALWFLGHVVGGAAISLATVVGLPIALLLLIEVWRSRPTVSLRIGDASVERAWAVPLALLIVGGLVLVVAATGVALAWLAPVVLGPDPIARLEELERRTSQLSERNRLAQELHDSIGHALTVTTLQAGAARRVLQSDPEFAEQALDAIARTSRAAAADLDDVLGILRNDPAARTPQPSLRDLDALIDGHRDAGIPVQAELDEHLGDVAGPVSREVYRIVQEGLTNVARHAGPVPTTVCVQVRDGQLLAQVRNGAPVTSQRRGRGGRGLAGIRERVALLGGEASAGPQGDGWLLDVRVPVGRTR